MKLKSTVLSILMLVFIVSCKQSTDTSSNTDQGDKISKEDIKEGLETAVFPLPEPMGVYNMLEGIGASYVGKVLNPVNAIEKYMITNVKAVNLGVYGADLSYALVNEKQDDIDAYSKAVKDLVDDLSIKIDYKTLMSADEDAEITSDSLVKLATNMFYNVYDFLYKESDPALAALMANGFYIEGLFIATHISDETFNNTEMVKIIYSQAQPLKELIKLNEKFPDNQYLQSLQGSLIKLKELYDATDGSLNAEQLQAITSTIEAIRDTLVS